MTLWFRLPVLCCLITLSLGGCVPNWQGTGQAVRAGLATLTPPAPPPDNATIDQLRPRPGTLLVFAANATDTPVAFQIGNQPLPRAERGEFVLAELPAGAVSVQASTVAALRNRLLGETTFQGPAGQRIFLVLARPRSLLTNPLDAAPLLTGGPDAQPFFSSYRLAPTQSTEIHRLIAKAD